MQGIAILFFFQSVYSIILQPSAKHFAHPVQNFFLNQLPVQRPYPFLAEIGVAEISVEILLREENVFPVVFLVGDVVFVQEDTDFHGDAFGRKVFENTVLINFPLYCTRCKREFIVGVIKFKMVVSDEPDA